MSWSSWCTLHVELAIAFGAMNAPAGALPLSIGASVNGISDGRIGRGAIGAAQADEYYTVGHTTYGKFGSNGGRLAGESLPMVEVKANVRSVLTKFGKADRFSSYGTGTCVIEFTDPDRDLDPLNLNGPYVVNGSSLLRRGAKIKVWADLTAGGTLDIFQGFVSSWPSSLEPFRDATRTVECVDWFGLLASYEGYPRTSVGDGDTVTQRINRLLDLVNVPTTDRDIGSSPTQLVATNLSGNLLTNLNDAAAADGGQLFVSPAGKITFVPRESVWLVDIIGSSSLYAELTNQPWSAVSTRVPYAGVPEIVETDAICATYFQRSDSDEYVLNTDTRLKDLLGWVTYERADMPNKYDADLDVLGGFTLASQAIGSSASGPATNSGPVQVKSVVIKPDVHTRAQGLVEYVHDTYSAQLIPIVKVTFDPPVAGASTINRTAFVTGIEHQIRATTWDTRLTLEDITNLRVFTVGTSVLGSTDFFP